MEFLWRQVQRVRLMQVLRAVVVDAFLALADTVGVTPTEQTRQLGCQHSGTLWRQIKHFTTIHTRPADAQPEAFFASLSLFLVHFTNTGWRICTLCVLFVLDSISRLMKYCALGCRSPPNVFANSMNTIHSPPPLCFLFFQSKHRFMRN